MYDQGRAGPRGEGRRRVWHPSQAKARLGPDCSGEPEKAYGFVLGFRTGLDSRVEFRERTTAGGEPGSPGARGGLGQFGGKVAKNRVGEIDREQEYVWGRGGPVLGQCPQG